MEGLDLLANVRLGQNQKWERRGKMDALVALLMISTCIAPFLLLTYCIDQKIKELSQLYRARSENIKWNSGAL